MKHITTLLLILVSLGILHAEGFKLKNDIWFRGSYSAIEIQNIYHNNYSLGAYYLPEIEYQPLKTGNSKLDLMLGGYFNGQLNLEQDTGEDIELESTDLDWKAEVYRAWARWSEPKYEVRLGLQKLNFGTAFILRNEQWFDSVDPTDAMGFTRGVWGGLLRYYTENNGTLWFWTILGDDDLKGNEYLSSKKYSLELGGRAQLSIFGGEEALSYHFRKLKKLSDINPEEEHRLALDGRWDTFVGLWYEATLSMYTTEAKLEKSHKYLTVGTDYTIGIGNGVHALAEHLYQATANDQPLSSVDEMNHTALQLEYPIGLYESLQGFAVYDWEMEKLNTYIAISRTTDYLTMILSYGVSSVNINETEKTIQFTLRMTY